MPMEGVVVATVVEEVMAVVLVEVTEVVSVAIVLDMVSPAIVLEESIVLVAISVEDGTEEAVTGEDVAITRTEDMAIPTSVFTPTTIPITRTGIGRPSVILMAGATESGCRTIIEGKGYFLL